MSASILPLLTKVADAINARRLSLDEAESRYTEAIAKAENDFEAALGYLGLSRHVVDALEIEAQKMSAFETPHIIGFTDRGFSVTSSDGDYDSTLGANAQTSVQDTPESEPTPEMAVAETVGVALVRAEVHALLKARREELPLTNAQIAERIGTDRKRITNIMGRPDYYKLEVLREFTAQLESLQATLTDDELLSIANGAEPQKTKAERRTERDEALARTRGLYERARKRFSVDQIAQLTGINAKRISNLLSPSTFCAVPAIRELGDLLEAMLAEPVAEKPLSCSVCAQPATQTTCHTCITAMAAQAKRESAVKPDPTPTPKQYLREREIIAAKAAQAKRESAVQAKPTPKAVVVDWMDAPLREIVSGKRELPDGFSLVRICIGGDVDSDIWQCVPPTQVLGKWDICYLKFTTAEGRWVVNPPTIVALAHRDAASDLFHRVVK